MYYMLLISILSASVNSVLLRKVRLSGARDTFLFNLTVSIMWLFILFGINDFGQCGIKSEDIFVMQPVKVSFPESAPNSINEAVCGAFHTICWMKGDVLYGFGQNDHQQVGNYEAEVLDYPVLVNWGCRKDGKFLKEIICGNAFTYLVKSISKEGVVKDVVEMKERYRKVSV